MPIEAIAMAESNLFTDFKPTTQQDWLDKIEKDLKGKSLESLSRTTRDGIRIDPVSFAEESAPKAQPLKEHPKWDAVQEILVLDVKEANKLALEHLNRGATSILFYLQGDEDLKELLKDIQIEYICLNLVTGSNPENLAKQLNALIAERGLEESEIEGSLNFDPLENLARTGNWFQNEESDFANLKAAENLLQKGIHGVCVNANLFANAGATEAQQLGIALAMAYEYIHRLELKDTRSFWINMAVGSDYFVEIAKLRSFRRLWRQLQNELGFKNQEVRLYAETAMRNKTISDRYNNMVRTTAETMAAIIGGASEISVKGFDSTYGEPSFFGERIAKNQQSILQHESRFQQVRDMAHGSYFIEDLTEKLAAKGWSFFKEIEMKGGFIESLKTCWLQDQVHTAAAQEQSDFDEGKKVLIGANRYRPENEHLKDFAKQAVFYAAPKKETTVNPFEVRRLSESIEKEMMETHS